MEGKTESKIGKTQSPKLGKSCTRFQFQIRGDRSHWERRLHGKSRSTSL